MQVSVSLEELPG